MRKTILFLLMMIFTVFVLAACGNNDEAEKSSETGEEESAMPEIPEPDLEGVPDVVAEVNGEEITKEEFESSYLQQYQQIAMQSQLSGQEVDQDQLKEQTAESLIGQKLLTQEADNRGAEATKEDINATIDLAAEQNGLESGDELIDALEEQGMKKEEVMSLIETQVKVDQLIAEESGDIKPTDEELKEAYEMIKAQQEQMGSEEELPSFDELKPDLEEQVKAEKESEVAQTLVEILRKESDVTVHL